jgi:hypothetical protein
MPGSGFDKIQIINQNGSLKLGGPLVIDGDDVAERLDVWVWQGKRACVAVLHNPPNPALGRWELITVPLQHHVGTPFEAGPAAAMALMVTRNTKSGEYEAYHWTQGVLLDDGRFSSILTS